MDLKLLRIINDYPKRMSKLNLPLKWIKYIKENKVYDLKYLCNLNIVDINIDKLILAYEIVYKNNKTRISDISWEAFLYFIQFEAYKNYEDRVKQSR